MISLTKIRMDNNQEADEYGDSINRIEFRLMESNKRYHWDVWNRKNIENEFNINEFIILDRKVNYLIKEFTKKTRIKNYLINNKTYNDLLEELSGLIINYRRYTLIEIIDRLVRSWKILFYVEYNKINNKGFYETSIFFNNKEYKDINTNTLIDILYKGYEEFYYHIGSSKRHVARTLYRDSKNKILEVLYLNQESDRLLRLLLELMDISMKTIKVRDIISENYKNNNITIKYESETENKKIIISAKNIRRTEIYLNEFENYFFRERIPYYAINKINSMKIIEDSNIYIELPKHRTNKIPLFELDDNFTESNHIQLFSFYNEKDYEDYINGKIKFEYTDKLFEIVKINYNFTSYNKNLFIRTDVENKIDINLFKNKIFKLDSTSEYMESNMQIGIDMLDFNL